MPLIFLFPFCCFRVLNRFTIHREKTRNSRLPKKLTYFAHQVSPCLGTHPLVLDEFIELQRAIRMQVKRILVNVGLQIKLVKVAV
jgi:hypothetical protein